MGVHAFVCLSGWKSWIAFDGMWGSWKFLDQSYSVLVLFAGILDQQASKSLIHHEQSEQSNIVKWKVSKKSIKITPVYIKMGVHAFVCLSGWKSWIIFDGMRGSWRFMDMSYWVVVLFAGILDQRASKLLRLHEQSERSNIAKWKVSKKCIKNFYCPNMDGSTCHWSVCLSVQV